MEKKKGPVAPTTDAPTSPEVTKSIRHRFAEGETSVMPLADVLRSRVRPALGQAAQGSDKTQIVHTPAGLAPPPGGQARMPSSQAKTQVVQLTAAQTALLSRTEPAPTQVSPQPERTVAAAAPTAPVAPRKEASLRTTLSSLSKEPDPSVAATQPTARAPQPSRLEDVVASGIAEAQDDAPVAQRAVKPAAAGPQEMAAPSKEGGRQRVANGCIVIFSCKGGSGGTMLSLNTAHQAAKDGHTACVVDLDLQMGDVLAAMGLSPRYNIAQASSALSEHVALGKSLLPTHASGVAVLSQVGTLDDMDKITPDSIAQLVLSVRQNFDVAVIDGVRDFSDNVLAILDVAEKITLVTVQEVLAIRRARWAFSILRRIGFDPQDITIVINRYVPSGDISLASIQSMFEPALTMTVPQETTAVTQSLNRGVPLLDTRSQSPVVHAVGQVCTNAIYDNIPMEDDAAANSGKEPGKPLWRRIFKRSGDTP